MFDPALLKSKSWLINAGWWRHSWIDSNFRSVRACGDGYFCSLLPEKNGPFNQWDPVTRQPSLLHIWLKKKKKTAGRQASCKGFFSEHSVSGLVSLPDSDENIPVVVKTLSHKTNSFSVTSVVLVLIGIWSEKCFWGSSFDFGKLGVFIHQMKME